MISASAALGSGGSQMRNERQCRHAAGRQAGSLVSRSSGMTGRRLVAVSNIVYLQSSAGTCIEGSEEVEC
jgi:hypothetical protein